MKLAIGLTTTAACFLAATPAAGQSSPAAPAQPQVADQPQDIATAPDQEN